MRVLALDPGGTTGWAIFDILADRENRLVYWRKPLQEHFTQVGQLDKPNHHHALRALLVRQDPDMIVCERFEPRNNDFAVQISLEYIGVAKEYAQSHAVGLILQGASQALTFCDNRKMEKLHLLLHPVKPWKDANAARKHLLYYLIFQSYFTNLSDPILKALRDDRKPWE